MTGSTSQVAAQPRSQPRVPDFFVVGHPKCGTSALFVMLRQHPQIFMSAIKEPRFFSPELRSRFRRPEGDKRPHTLDGYLALFAGARPDQRVGEASPTYLRSTRAAARIAEVAPHAQIVAILREPASFLRSFHLQCVHDHIESENDFARALALEPQRREGRRIPRFSHSPATLLYSEHVRYVEQLRRFHERFAAERVLVLLYEDFRDDNEATLRQVLRFLDVDAELPVPTVRTDTLAGVRSKRMHALARRLEHARRNPDTAAAHWRLLSGVAPKAGRGRRLKALWSRAALSEAKPPDERLMQELRQRFKPEVLALSEYLDRDLVSLWGYDRLG